MDELSLERKFEGKIKYYNKIKNILFSSNKSFNGTIDENRLKDELNLLYKTNASKGIYYCYKIAEEAKANNEPYIVLGTVANLYILYLLGVTKFNPIEYKCYYQTCLGTINKPREFLSFKFNFRSEYYNKIKGLIINKETNSIYEKFLEYKVDNNSFSRSSMRFKIDGNSFYFSKSNNILSIIRPLKEKYGDVNFDEAFKDFKTVIFDENFTTKFYASNAKRIGIKTIDDAIKIEEINRISHIDRNTTSTKKFYDRESIYDYFVNVKNISEEEALAISEAISMGHFSLKVIDKKILKELVTTDELNELANIFYLPPKGDALGALYWKIKASHFYLNYKEEYLKLREFYNRCDFKI